MSACNRRNKDLSSRFLPKNKFEIKNEFRGRTELKDWKLDFFFGDFTADSCVACTLGRNNKSGQRVLMINYVNNEKGPSRARERDGEEV